MQDPTHFLVKVTDTFNNELNYSWVRRFKVKANTERGAISKVSRFMQLSFRKRDSYNNYKAIGAHIGAFVEDYNYDIQHHLTKGYL